MSRIQKRSLAILSLAFVAGTGAIASDRGTTIKGEPDRSFNRRRPPDLTNVFVQRTPDFSLDYAGKRVSPTMTGLIYHGERIEGNQVLLGSQHGDVRGWAPLSAVVRAGEGEAFFSTEIARRPADSFAFLMRGLIRFERGEHETALADLNEVLRLDPKNVQALVARSALDIFKNRPDQARADANKAVELDSRNSYALEQRAMVLCSLGQHDLALRDFERCLELGSRCGMMYVARGIIFFKRGELEKAKVEIDHALETFPVRTDALMYLAAIHMKRSESTKAMTAIDKAIQIDPECGDAYAARAAVHFSLGNHDQALKDLNEAVRLSPGNSTLLENRAQLKFEKAEFDSALADLETAIHLNPDNQEAHHGRSWILATCTVPRIRNARQAVISATRACELAKYKNAKYIATLAIAYSETGDLEAAVKWQERAIDLVGPDDPARRDFVDLLKRYKAGKPYHRLRLLEEIGLKAPTIAAKTGPQNPG